jgi:hypothetical protein
VNLIGTPGQTIDAGSFTYTNTLPDTSELLSSVTVTVSKPKVLSSLTLTAVLGQASQSVTVAAPTATTIFQFESPISVPPGETVNFSMTAVISGGTSGGVKSSIISFNMRGGPSDGSSGSGFGIQAILASMRDAGSGRGLLLLATALLPMLLISFVFEGGFRQRIVAASLGIIVSGMTMTGCDPCPACTTAKLTTTDQYLVDITVTDSEGNPLLVAGTPGLVSQLSE